METSEAKKNSKLRCFDLVRKYGAEKLDAVCSSPASNVHQLHILPSLPLVGIYALEADESDMKEIRHCEFCLC